MWRYRKPALFVFIPVGVTIVMVYLVSSHPVMLVPPLTPYTVFVYPGVISLAWLSLAYFVYRSPGFRKILLAVPLMLCSLSVLCWCAMSGPYLEAMMPLLADDFACVKEEADSGHVLYRCSYTGGPQVRYEDFTLEGRKWLPFARRID